MVHIFNKRDSRESGLVKLRDQKTVSKGLFKLISWSLC
jgi:hypothetical protein